MGNRNAYKTGYWTADARQMRALIRELVTEGRSMARAVMA